MALKLNSVPGSVVPMVLSISRVLLLAVCATPGCTSPILDLERYRGAGFDDRHEKEAASVRRTDVEKSPEDLSTFSTRARQIEKNLGY